ncbi:MAG: hypothetical protein K8T25_00710 [Planctomycetia bacterium]|nr:hypothetical protein [Planctomycetia bacterium]
MPKLPPASETASKKDRKYPYYALSNAIKLGAVVARHGGERVGVPKSVIAQDLDMDQAAASFAQATASAKTFGIVEGGAELRLTDLGRDYFAPTTSDESRLAELEFLAQPTAFSFLIDKFDGSKLPGKGMLANLLGRACGVPQSWRDRVAQLFISATNDLGVVDASGSLRYSAAKHHAGQHMRPTAVDAITNPMAIAPPAAVHQSDAARLSAPADRKDVWESGGLRLEMPDPLPRHLWERLKKIVDAMEPAEDPTKE